MQRLHRDCLPSTALRYLRKKQGEIDGGSPARPTWKNARSTRPMLQVEATLKKMAGRRGRCMYCEDSRGTDIDHYWPMSKYSEKTFLWENLLWSCTDCNRHKLARFLLGGDGSPLLLDPTVDDPWDHLFYDTATGNITPRFDAESRREDPRGRETVDCIPALSDEAVTDGRVRTYRNLRRAVDAFLTEAERDPLSARRDLLESLHDNSGYGLVAWYFLREGREQAPFSVLRRSHQQTWDSIVESLRGP